MESNAIGGGNTQPRPSGVERDLGREARVRAVSLWIRIIAGAVAAAMACGMASLWWQVRTTGPTSHGPGDLIALCAGALAIIAAAAVYVLGYFLGRHSDAARLLIIAIFGLGATWALVFLASLLNYDTLVHTSPSARGLALAAACLGFIVIPPLVGGGAGRLFTEEYRRKMGSDPGAAAPVYANGVFWASAVLVAAAAIAAGTSMRADNAARLRVETQMRQDSAAAMRAPKPCGPGTDDPYCQRKCEQCCEHVGGSWRAGTGYDGLQSNETPAFHQARYGCCSADWPDDFDMISSCRVANYGGNCPSSFFRCEGP